MIYILALVLIVLVLVTFIAPVVRQRSNMVSHTDSAHAMMHDQLDEVDRDVARGLISAVDGHSARIEIQRRIIALNKEQGLSVVDDRTGAWAMVGAGVLVPVVGAILYLAIGSPSMPSAVFAQRGEERAAVADQNNQTHQLLVALQAASDGGATNEWLTLAAAYMDNDRFNDAAEAFGQVLERKEAAHFEFTSYAEALILSENGVVTPVAEAALDRSLEMEPGNISGIFYKSFALEQAGNVNAAYTLLITRLETAQGQPPWVEAFVARANHYGKKLGKAPITLSGEVPALRGPTTEDGVATGEMSAEERTAFIASMVDRLANRLESRPDDFEGWLQLARAYSVLNDEPQALAAYRQAQRLAQDGSGAAASDPDDRQAMLISSAVAISGNINTKHIGARGLVHIDLLNHPETQEMELAFKVADGWHINAHLPLDDFLIPTSLNIEDVSARVNYPEPVIKSLSFNDAPLALYEGSFSLHVAKSKGPNKAQLTIQACSDEICLPPEEMVFVFW